MTLLWMEGFEVRRNNVVMDDIYDPYTGIDLSGGGALGRKHGFSIVAGGNSTLETPVLVSSVSADFVIQFAVRKATHDDLADAPGIEIITDGSGTQVELRMIDGDRHGTFKLELLRGAVSLAVTGNYSYGGPRAWHCFQLAINIHTTTGSANLKHWDVENNVTTNVINISGVNTADQATNGADKVKFNLATGLSDIKVWDDLVVMDGLGSINNAQTSVPILVYGQVPQTDGPTLDWDVSTGSDHSDVLDEGPDSAGDGERITSDTVTNLDEFVLSAVPEMPDTATPAILGMMMDLRGAMVNSGSRTVRVNIDDPSGGDAEIATDLIWTTTNVESRILIMETNPVSTLAWTLADIEDHLFGVKLHA